MIRTLSSSSTCPYAPDMAPAVLAALARALRLTQDERDPLFPLAGQPPSPRPGTPVHVSSGVLHLLDRLVDTPAPVTDDLGTVLVQNRMSALVSGPMAGRTGHGHNAVRSWFTRPEDRAGVPVEDWQPHSRTHAADLRATVGRRGDDVDVRSLLAALLAAGEEFAALWAEHEVGVRRADAKPVIHPEVGLLDLLCERLTSDVDGSRLVVLPPAAGHGLPGETGPAVGDRHPGPAPRSLTSPRDSPPVRTRGFRILPGPGRPESSVKRARATGAG